MISKIKKLNIFAKLFTIGLLLLFINTLNDSVFASAGLNFYIPGANFFFAAGLIICLVSFLFLLIEWLVLPFGNKTKRIKLYQGAGNVFAFLMLVSGYLLKEQTAQNHFEMVSLAVSSSGLAIALLFAWGGGSIASFVSSKKIKLPDFNRKKQPVYSKSTIKSTLEEARLLGETITKGVPQKQAAQN